jgi:predicted acylesterase/phospholipase RssA
MASIREASTLYVHSWRSRGFLAASAAIGPFVAGAIGRPQAFSNVSVTPDALHAAVCLLAIFQAIEIDGDACWDGGYSRNPTTSPLLREERKNKDSQRVMARRCGGGSGIGAERRRRQGALSPTPNA